MADRSITDLDPAFLHLVNNWLQCCQAITPGKIRIIVTWRSSEEQNQAHADNPTVNRASAGESPHNCCDAQGNPAARAVDFGIFENDGTYVSNGLDPRYRQAGEMAEQCQMVWGGSFTHPDWDHVEMQNWKRVNLLS